MIFDNETHEDLVDWECPWGYYQLFILESEKRVWFYGEEVILSAALYEFLINFIKFRGNNKYVNLEKLREELDKEAETKTPIKTLQRKISRINEEAQNALQQKSDKISQKEIFDITKINNKIIEARTGYGYYLTVSPQEHGLYIR